jgi:hypothetical protein
MVCNVDPPVGTYDLGEHRFWIAWYRPIRLAQLYFSLTFVIRLAPLVAVAYRCAEPPTQSAKQMTLILRYRPFPSPLPCS